MPEPDDLEARVTKLEVTVARLVSALREEVPGLQHDHHDQPDKEEPEGKSDLAPRARAGADAGAPEEEETKEKPPKPEAKAAKASKGK